MTTTTVQLAEAGRHHPSKGARNLRPLGGVAVGWLVPATIALGAAALTLVPTALLEGGEIWPWSGLLAGALLATVLQHRRRPNRWTTAAGLGSPTPGRAALLVGAAVVAWVATVPLLGQAPLLLLPVAALAEELLLRWLPVRAQLVARATGLVSVAVVATATAVVFAAAHGAAHPLVLIDRLVFGLLAYAICLRSRDVWHSFAFHLTSNAVATLLVAGPIEGATAFALLLAADLVGGIGLAILVRTDDTNRPHGPAGPHRRSATVQAAPTAVEITESAPAGQGNAPPRHREPGLRMELNEYLRDLAMHLRWRRLGEVDVRRTTQDVARQVHSTGQSPTELFGPPSQYARQFPQGTERPRGLVVASLGMAIAVVVAATVTVNSLLLNQGPAFPVRLAIYAGALVLVAIGFIVGAALDRHLPEGLDPHGH